MSENPSNYTAPFVRAADAAPASASILRFARNALHLLTGNAASIGLGMVTLAFTAQILGPALFGILATIEGYCRMVDQVVRLETWQALIRYGAETLETGTGSRFRSLVRLGLVLDFGGAALAALIALAGVSLVGPWLGWGAAEAMMARVYCITVLFGISSTPIAVLRLFDRFAVVAWIEPVLALARLVGVVIIWALDGSIWPLLILGIALQCCQRLMLGWFGWRELMRQGHAGVLQAPLKGVEQMFPGFRRHLLAANATLLIRKSTQELDLLVVAAYAGPAGAGIYQLVRKFTLAATKAGAMVQQVVYPDLARSWARRDLAAFHSTIRQMEAVTLTFGLVLFATACLASDHIVAILGGGQFEDAVHPLIAQTFAGLLFLSGSALKPGIASMGLQMAIMPPTILAGCIFYLVLFLAVPQIGVVGASLAHIAFNLILLPASLLICSRGLRAAGQAPSSATG